MGEGPTVPSHSSSSELSQQGGRQDVGEAITTISLSQLRHHENQEAPHTFAGIALSLGVQINPRTAVLFPLLTCGMAHRLAKGQPFSPQEYTHRPYLITPTTVIHRQVQSGCLNPRKHVTEAHNAFVSFFHHHSANYPLRLTGLWDSTCLVTWVLLSPRLEQSLFCNLHFCILGNKFNHRGVPVCVLVLICPLLGRWSKFCDRVFIICLWTQVSLVNYWVLDVSSNLRLILQTFPLPAAFLLKAFEHWIPHISSEIYVSYFHQIWSTCWCYWASTSHKKLLTGFPSFSCGLLGHQVL